MKPENNEWIYSNITDVIGYYGPLILIVTNIYFLRNKFFFLIVFLVGWLFNVFLNKILKLIFKEKRPNINNREVIFEYFKNEESYGMPSGHSQSVFFSLTFLFLVNKSYDILYFSLFIACFTIYQRLIANAHTSSQLFVGSILGISFAWFVYYITIHYIDSKSFFGYINL